MGSILSFIFGETPIVKKGELYSSVRDHLQPFDLLLFNGGDFVADMITYVESKQPTDTSDTSDEASSISKEVKRRQFSHVGIVVTSEVLDHPLVKPGTIYILESTLSGRLGNGVKNIEGETFFGVQLRNFDELMPLYDKPNDAYIATTHLKNNPWTYGSPDTKKCIKSRFTELFDRINGTPYNANPYSLLAAVFPCLRPERKVVETLFGTKKWLFCSELVALVYKTFGIYPSYVNIENVIPDDYVERDIDRIPCIAELPITFITTEYHK